MSRRAVRLDGDQFFNGMNLAIGEDDNPRRQTTWFERRDQCRALNARQITS